MIRKEDPKSTKPPTLLEALERVSLFAENVGSFLGKDDDLYIENGAVKATLRRSDCIAIKDALKAEQSREEVRKQLVEAVRAVDFFKAKGMIQRTVWAFVGKNAEHPLWMKFTLDGSVAASRWLDERLRAALKRWDEVGA